MFQFAGLSYSNAEDVACHSAGYFCGPTCKTFFRCIDLGNGQLLLDKLFTCDSNEFCNADTMACDTTPDHCAKAHEFKCVDVWRFPLPHGCSSYVECSTHNVIAYTGKCSDGLIYNPCNHNCTAGVCSISVPVCNRLLQSGPVPNTDNKYYVCNQEFYPEQHSCGNYTFDPTTLKCTSSPSHCIP